MLNQYYTFHPRLLRAEPSGVEDTRPSVLEMENKWVLLDDIEMLCGQIFKAFLSETKLIFMMYF